MKFQLCFIFPVLFFISSRIFCQLAEGSEIIIIRHGLAEHNVKNIRNANPNHPNYTVCHLVEEGIQEVLATAMQLKKEGLTGDDVCMVYVSPLPRTRQTASIIMKELSINETKMVIEPMIIERQAGDLEGQPFTSLLDYDSSAQLETDEAVQARMQSFFDHIIDAHAGERATIIVVTHGLPAQLLGELISGSFVSMDTGEARRFYFDSESESEEETEVSCDMASGTCSIS